MDQQSIDKNVIVYNTIVLGPNENLLMLSSSPPSSSSGMTTNILYDQYKGQSDTSSPIGKTDSSENYDPSHWAERAGSVQLASSPDRHQYNRAHSPLSSSPLRSSPIFFSPPTRVLCNDSINKSLLYQTPQNNSNALNRRGRPKLEEISELILSGSNSKSSIKCDVCHRVFPREKSLQAHLRTHTGERPYKCSYSGCNRAFAQSGQLRTHIRLHTGEKPFICRETGCGNLFTHPNRRCATHPRAGVKRIIPVLVTKKENRRTDHVMATTPKIKPNKKTKVLGNITSQVNNSPVKRTISNFNCLPVARKSVINHVGRASRKLDAELCATVTTQPDNNDFEKFTFKESKLNSTQSTENHNNMDILGAIALMELAGVYPGKQANNNIENSSPNYMSSSPKKK